MGFAFSLALGVAFVLIGVGGVIAPRISAGQYGLPTTDPSALALIRALGARDLVIGALALASLGEVAIRHQVFGWAILAAIADAAVVFSVRGWRPQHIVHLGGAIALAIAARV
jgi:Domain of unknown function (DUF4267)